MNEDTIVGGAIVIMWVLGMLSALGFVGVIIWAMIRFTIHFTGG